MQERLSWVHAPADALDPSYDFAGARGKVRWPKSNGRNLGGAGLWNFLWRLGIRPGPPELAGEGPIILALDGPLPPDALRRLRARLEHGSGPVIASGDPAALAELLPNDVRIEPHASPYPAAALAWTGLICDAPQIVAPPAWHFFRVADGVERIETFGALVAVGGERQSPARALRLPLGAPAAIRYGRLVLLNGNPFAALQAWLQGQEDLEPWLAWRNGMFWLDEQVECLADALEVLGLPLSSIAAPGIPGLAETTVVLRHDLDSSRDTSMLEAALAQGARASHAILLDENAEFWMERLARAPAHEAAFHYDTLRSDTRIERARRFVGWRPATEYRPARRTIAGTGLFEQVRSARARGIAAHTLHRHASFILYPELVDALDFVFERDRAVVGGSSFFGGQVLRWGIDRTDGARGTVGSFPYPMFPFWLPFKLAHAGDGGRISRGFETTSVMEAEPALVAQMLDYRPRRIRQRIFTLSYHPFHANRPGFDRDGTLPWFETILEELNARRIHAVALAETIQKLHDFLTTDEHS